MSRKSQNAAYQGDDQPARLPHPAPGEAMPFSLGWLPILALVAACGFAAIVVAEVLRRRANNSVFARAVRARAVGPTSAVSRKSQNAAYQGDDQPARLPHPAPGEAMPFSLGWLPILALVAACGFAAIVVADDISRAGKGRLDFIFWLGLLAIVVPPALRLLSRNASREERIGLVLVVGLELYLVKVAYAPFTFLFADEFVHQFNVRRILETNSLFVENPLLEVTRGYPGLETVAAALADLTGLKPYGAGLVIVGAARLLAMLALYLFFEMIAPAPVAGLGALLYAANANFLFFDAQFKYESLALPLAIATVFAVVRWQSAEPCERRLWTCVAVAGIFAVVITHHMSSYALLSYLVIVTLLHALLRKSGRTSPWGFALLTACVTVAWLVFVAGETRGYLSSVFRQAFEGFLDTVSNKERRSLLVSETGETSPAWERVVAIASVGLMAIALPFAFRALSFRKQLREPHLLILAIASVAFIASFLLRFSPGAWETANRASEFLFVGMGLMLAIAAFEFERQRASRGPWGRQPARQRLSQRRRVLAVFASVVAIIFMGGNMAGWPRDLRLPATYRVATEWGEIEPQGVAIANWARANLSRRPGLIADDSTGRLLLARGIEFPYNDGEWGVGFVLHEPRLYNLTFDLIRDFDMRYAVVDRRRISSDNLRGYYFSSENRHAIDLRPREAYSKFERLRGAHRLADTGDIVVYALPKSRAAPR